MKKLYSERFIKNHPEYLHGREKRQGGTLYRWRLVNGQQGATVAIGYIHDDPHWHQGEQLKTSAVVAVDLEAKTLETLNTIYRLDYE